MLKTIAENTALCGAFYLNDGESHLRLTGLTPADNRMAESVKRFCALRYEESVNRTL